jgi:hypothetical protein
MTSKQRKHYNRLILFIILLITGDIGLILLLLAVSYISYFIVTEFIIDEGEAKVE